MKENATDSAQLRQVLEEIRATQQRIAEESARLAAQIQELLARVGSQSGLISQPYEFFRATSGWQIKFDGQVVRSGRNDKGFQYIHKLLEYPNIKFSPTELDPNITGTEGQSLIAASDSIFVEHSARLQAVNPNNADDLLRSLKDMMKNPPDKDAPLPQHIYHYSEVCYLAESLKNIETKPSYIEAYKSAKQKLDDLVFEFECECDDKLFVARVLRESGMIRSVARDTEDVARKMRDRITKNIKNAIASLNNEALRAYFTEHIEFGAKSIYRPDTVKPIRWQLHTYE